MNTKQVIVMRKDLGMRKGKMIAQGAHASMGALLTLFGIEDVISSSGDKYHRYCIQFGDNCILSDWLNGKFTKICVGVNSEEELLDIYKKAQDANLPVKLITDSGLTEFHGEPTNTCLCIGPYTSEEIDRITGHLSLL